MDRYLDNQKNYRTLVNTPLATARLNSVEAGGRVYPVRECPCIPLLQNKPRDHPSGCDALYLLRWPGLFQALHRLGVGLGWLYVAAGTPHLLMRQFPAEHNVRLNSVKADRPFSDDAFNRVCKFG